MVRLSGRGSVLVPQKLEQQMGREQLSMLFRHLITIELNKRHSINTEVEDLNQVLKLLGWKIL